MPLLNYIRHDGPTNTVPLVIAHGLFGSARNWNVIAKKLASDRQVIAVDMRNHGESFWDNDNSYPALADDLVEIITHFSGKAHVLGHSMGGKAAMVLALSRPELVDRLIAVDIAPVAYTHSHAANIAAMRSVDLNKVTRRSEADAQLAQHLPDAGLRAFFIQSLAITPEGAKWKLNLDALEQNATQIIGFPAITSQFASPTLFLKGALSDYINPANEPQIRALFPNSKISQIEGAGHWLQADKPGELTETVAGFLTN